MLIARIFIFLGFNPYVAHNHMFFSVFPISLLSVQSYYNSTSEWEYLTQLNKFVDEGMKDESFIEAVNNIVARGCHLPPCSPALSIKSDRYLFGFEVRA